MRLVVTLVCGLALGTAYAGDAAWGPEPSATETLILEYINRLRADPAADAERLVAKLPRGVDAAMFQAEMKALKPAPPLVLDPRLIATARQHDRYMIANGMSHEEVAGKAGFSGAHPEERIRSAGFAGAAGAENIFLQAPSAWDSHIGFVVDPGPGGTGGMQPGRGHRANLMNPTYRQIGVGVVPHGDRLAVTHDLAATRGSGRFVGGVVFVDRGGDGFYGLGEGKGGVTVTADDGARTVTWLGGAYTLPLRGTGSTTLTFTYAGHHVTKPVPGGGDNAKVDWAVPAAIEDAAVDQLLAALGNEADAASPAHLKAAVALAIGARQLVLGQDRAGAVAAALGDTGDRLAAAQDAVRAGFDQNDAAAFRALLADPAKTYAGTAAAEWFREAQLVDDVGRAVSRAEHDIAAAKALVPRLAAQRDALRAAEFRARLDDHIARAVDAGR